MKTYKVVKLKFDAPFHLSQGKPNYEDSATMLHSDTIKSALCVMAMQLYGLKNDKEIDFAEGLKIEEFFGKFKCSSAFPYYRDELFFPKPMAKLPFGVAKHGQDEEVKTSKTLRKIRYIGKDFFELALKNDNSTIDIEDHEFLQKDQFISKKIKHKDAIVFKKSTVQRVRVPKLSFQGRRHEKKGQRHFRTTRRKWLRHK